MGQEAGTKNRARTRSGEDGQRGVNYIRSGGPAAGGILWGILILLLSVDLVAGFAWVINDPQANNWDEAGYLNQVNSDHYIFQSDGLLAYVQSWFTGDAIRPPAYRLLATPFSLSSGVVSVTSLRWMSLIAFGLSLVLLYKGAVRVADRISRFMAILIVSLSPAVLAAAKTFGTEYPSYLAVSGVLFFLLRNWDQEAEPSKEWIGLGLALALAAWSKLSTLGVAIPMIAAAFLFGLIGWIRGPKPVQLAGACLLGMGLALPWYVMNLSGSLRYVMYSIGYVRHSIGSTIWRRLLNWPLAFSEHGLGLPVAVALLGILTYGLFKLRKQPGDRLSGPSRSAMIVCLAGFLPPIIVQIAGQNQSMRLIAPALLPLGVCIGIVISTFGVLRSKYLATGMVVLLLLQLGSMITTLPLIPGLSDTFERTQRWDWELLREAAIRNNTPTPAIAYLGNGSLCNPPQIRSPWINRNETVKVTWLWRYEDGDIDWDKMMASLSQFDIVFSLPGYIGNPRDKQDLDNAHNQEFVDRLNGDTRFVETRTLYMGEDKVPVVVFVKRP